MVTGMHRVCKFISDPFSVLHYVRNRLTDMENRHVVAKAQGDGLRFRVSRCKLLHLKRISSEVLLHSTGNYVQSLRIEHDRRYYVKKKKKNKHTHMWTYVYGCIYV